HLQKRKAVAERMITDQAKLPSDRAAMIADYGRPGEVDRTRASYNSLRGGHHMKRPRRDGCEAKEAEQQTGAGAEPHKCTDLVSSEAHLELPTGCLPV